MKDVIYNKNVKSTTKKKKNTLSFYVVLFLLVFCVIGAFLGTFAFIENRVGESKTVYAEDSGIIEYENLIVRDVSGQGGTNYPFYIVGSGNIYEIAKNNNYNGSTLNTRILSLDVVYGNYYTIYINSSYIFDSSWYLSFTNRGSGTNVRLFSSHINSFYTFKWTQASTTLTAYFGFETSIPQFNYSFGIFAWQGQWTINNITDSMIYQIGYTQGILNNYNSIYQQGYSDGYSDSYDEFSENFNANTMLNPFISNNVVFALINDQGTYHIPCSFGDNFIYFPGLDEPITGDLVMSFNYPFLLTKHNFSPNIFATDFGKLFDYSRLTRAYKLDFTFYLQDISKNTAIDIDPGFGSDVVPLNRKSSVDISYVIASNGFNLILPDRYFDSTIGTTTGTDESGNPVTFPGSFQPFTFDSLYIYGIRFNGYTIYADNQGNNGEHIDFDNYNKLGNFVLLFNGFGADFTSGYNQGFKNGYDLGYSYAYNKGAYDSNNYTFTSLIGAVIDAPIKALSGLLNFEILGVNLLNFFLGLMTLAIIIFVIRLFL